MENKRETAENAAGLKSTNIKYNTVVIFRRQHSINRAKMQPYLHVEYYFRYTATKLAGAGRMRVREGGVARGLVLLC